MVKNFAYLSKAGLVDYVKKGVYKINKDGLKLLNENLSVVTPKLLASRYPSFREFNYGYKLDGANNGSSEVEEETSSQTPETLIDNSINIINTQLAEELLEKVLEQSPQFFESLVVDLLVYYYVLIYQRGIRISTSIKDCQDRWTTISRVYDKV